MKRSVFFCKSWFRAKKCPTEIWTTEQARAARKAKQHYTVLVDSIDRPYCFLDITDKAVGVGFLDIHLREYLTYGFQEVASDSLFLTVATHRQFEGDTDTVNSGTSYVFGRDGTVEIKREFFNPHRLEAANKTADVSANYCASTEFGEYDEFIKIGRSQIE